MKTLYFIIHHFIRPVWSLIFNIPITLYFLIIYLSSRHNREGWNENKKNYENLKTVDDLVKWFRDEYYYTSDPLGGAIDHDSTSLEFFSRFGDCDSAALYGVKALKRMGHKAHRILIWGKGENLIEKIKNQHYAIYLVRRKQ